MKIKRALISVSDKTGLIPFAKSLHKQNIEILSTGGTLKALKDAGIPARPVEEFTGFPEILEGRVKTLHPKIHGGLLYRRDKKSHEAEAKKHGIEAIDLVVVNLYPFEEATKEKSADLETAIENIDIGGPSMLRSAAKNFSAVAVVCDPADYESVLKEIEENQGKVSEELRKKLALKVFERTACYDRAIASFLSTDNGKHMEEEAGARRAAPLPPKIDWIYEKAKDLRYGENPHQKAGLYLPKSGKPYFHFEALHGKELSFNNILDIEGTLDILREFDEPAACVVKHTNPCGVSEAADITEALERAIECDQMSAFGGIVGINRACDSKTAKLALERLNFFEVFAAPSFEPSALALLKQRKNLRLIATGAIGDGSPYDFRMLQCGLLVQTRNLPLRLHLAELRENIHFPTKAKLAESEIDDLLFAYKCVKVVKSNAIVITQGRQTVGIGAGQMSRVDSVEIACRKAGYRTDGAILASDAFFPMPDAIETAHDHKIRAIIQPGGSVRDADIIAACDKFGLAMAFTGERHFKH